MIRQDFPPQVKKAQIEHSKSKLKNIDEKHNKDAPKYENNWHHRNWLFWRWVDLFLSTYFSE